MPAVSVPGPGPHADELAAQHAVEPDRHHQLEAAQLRGLRRDRRDAVGRTRTGSTRSRSVLEPVRPAAASAPGRVVLAGRDVRRGHGRRAPAGSRRRSVTPSASASYVRIKRWRSTSGATSKTSCGGEEATAAEHGERAAGGDHAERRARARAERDVRSDLRAGPTPRVARRHHEADRVVEHRVVHEHLVGDALQREQLLDREHLRAPRAPSRPCGARSRSPRCTTADPRRSASGSGRAAPRAARTHLPTRSGSASRARGTGSATARCDRRSTPGARP